MIEQPHIVLCTAYQALIYIPQQHRVRLISKSVSPGIVGTPRRKHSNYTFLFKTIHSWTTSTWHLHEHSTSSTWMTATLFSTASKNTAYISIAQLLTQLCTKPLH